MKYGNRPGSNRKPKPKWAAGDRYDVASYRRAIARACDKAFSVPANVEVDPKAKAKWQADHRWHPHQLRHSAATELRKRFGIEAAQVMLGHRTLSVTQLYAEKNIDAAKRIAAQVG